MPRLESLFSVQVTQPYLNEPFPIRSSDPTDDRLFRHITFFEDDPDVTVRLRAVDRNYISNTAVLQKKVPTNIFVNDINQEVFRIKAVLSQPEHGQTESYWVTQKNMEPKLASTHNQYRIRGVSDKNWKGDWVYSELRDFDNDLIVYNMLYDILDLLNTVHDNQLEYVMDYIVADAFIKIINDQAPRFATSLDSEEFKTASLTELITILANKMNNNPNEQLATVLGENFLALSDLMKKEFKENVMSAPEEFATLYRTYKLFDQYQNKNKDLVGLLVEIFLEDRLEKMVQKTDIEVILQNDEEMGIYLNGVYEFDIKNELITAIYEASPDDHFVSKLNDAVQLLSEPVVFEELVYHQNEDVAQFLRIALSELYASLTATDIRLLELEHELEDFHKISPTGSIVEFATMNDDFTTRYAFIYDIVESLIKGDLDLRHSYEIVIVEHILSKMIDSRKALFIDYNLDEFLEVFMNMGESFRAEYNKSFGTFSESKNIHMNDYLEVHNTTSGSKLVERYQTVLMDTAHLVQSKNKDEIKENQHVSLIEHVLDRYLLFKKSVNEVIQASLADRINYHDGTIGQSKQEIISAFLMDHVNHVNSSVHQSVIEFMSTIVNDNARYRLIQENFLQYESFHADQMDNALLEDINQYFRTQESTLAGFEDLLSHKDINRYFMWIESILEAPEDMYFNLFRHHFRDPNRYPILERKHFELSHDLRDMFILDGSDIVNYATGDMEDGWSVGVFKLGNNTLKGEVT